jgi:NADPH:quinone reductase-like Zn-dependent oxidoreductase
MSAITYDHFGSLDVLTLADTAHAATIPAHSVEVAMHASSINTIDVRAREGLLAPLVNKKFPKTPGADVSGIVIRVGAKVTSLKVGDIVFGATDPFKGGAFADRVMLPAKQLAKKPTTISHKDAATLPIAGLAALYSVRELGQIKAGQRVLIYGSSGAVGLFAIQLAKTAGAHVTTISGPEGVAAARDLGADVSIDYRAGPVKLDGQFDLILEYASVLNFADARALLTAKGRFVDASPSIPKVIGSKIANLFRAQQNLMLMTTAKSRDLDTIAAMAARGTLKTTIAATFRLDEAKAAFRAHETHGVVGKIVVTAH